MKAEVVAICCSEEKGVQKTPVTSAVIREDFGIVGDAHAGNWHRQVSLLAQESIDKMRQKGLTLKDGDFAENIVTRGIDLLTLPVGTGLALGEVRLEITQIGKECHQRCAIYEQAGDCVMPREGVFARVVTGGVLRAGDTIEPLMS